MTPTHNMPKFFPHRKNTDPALGSTHRPVSDSAVPNPLPLAIRAPPLLSHPPSVPPAPSLVLTAGHPYFNPNSRPPAYSTTSAFAPQQHYRQPSTAPHIPTSVSRPPQVHSSDAIAAPHTHGHTYPQVNAAYPQTQAHSHHVQPPPLVQTQSQGYQYSESSGERGVFTRMLSSRFKDTPEPKMLLNRLSFLMFNRPVDFEAFSTECNALYVEKYSRRKKQNHAQSDMMVASQQQSFGYVPNPSTTPSNSHINGQTQAVATNNPNVASFVNGNSHANPSVTVPSQGANPLRSAVPNPLQHANAQAHPHVAHKEEAPLQQHPMAQPDYSAAPVTGPPVPASAPAISASVPHIPSSVPVHSNVVPPTSSAPDHSTDVVEPAVVANEIEEEKDEKQEVENVADEENDDDEGKADWEYDEPDEWRDKIQLFEAKRLAYERYRKFIEKKKELEALDQQTPSNAPYVIWRCDTTKNREANPETANGIEDDHREEDGNWQQDIVGDCKNLNEVVLQKSVCSDHQGIAGNSNQFPAMCLNALRFFWTYLVADTVPGGAIFSHGIGFPKQHLLILFAHLYCTTFIMKTPSQRKKLLLITSTTGLSQWEKAAEYSAPEFGQFKMSRLSTADKNDLKTQEAILPRQVEEIEKWQLHGGLLLCSYDDYISLTSSSCRTDTNPLSRDEKTAEGILRDKVFRNLCVKGPDIAIIDEATRLAAYDPLTRGLFSRISTHARLALTSVTIGGNLTNMHAISNWACPTLLGRSPSEFWVIYMEAIIRGNQTDSGTPCGQRSYFAARSVWRALRHVTLTIDMNERQEALQMRGKVLSECSIELNFSSRERVFYKQVSEYLFDAAKRENISCYLAAYLLSICTISIPTLMQLLEWLISFGNDVHSRYERVTGFLRSLSGSMNDGPPTDEEQLNSIKRDLLLADMADEFKKTSRCLSGLRDSIKQDLEKDGIYDMPGRKMAALKKMVRMFLKQKNRVAVFVSCEQLQEELVKTIELMRLDPVSNSTPMTTSTTSSSSTASSTPKQQEINVDERKQIVFNYKPDDPNGMEQLQSFNTSDNGAVLIAPYGSNVSCSEDNGWSFVNATKVIMLEYSWLVQPIVQALHRVHNFAWQGGKQVDVIYLKIDGSVDCPIDVALSRRFTHLTTQTSEFSAGGFSGPFPCHDIAGYRGFLIEPELSPLFIQPLPCLTITPGQMPKVPIIDRNSGQAPSPQRAQWLEQLKNELLQMENKKKKIKPTGRLSVGDDENDILSRLPLSKFQFSVTRFAELSNVLELPFVSDSDVLVRSANDEQKANPFENDLAQKAPDASIVARAIRSRTLSLLPSDRTLKDRDSNLTPFAFNCLFSYADSSFLNIGQASASARNGMLDSWRYYFLLYESSERRKRYVMPVPLLEPNREHSNENDGGSRGSFQNDRGRSGPNDISPRINSDCVHEDDVHRSNLNDRNNPNFSNSNFRERDFQERGPRPESGDRARQSMDRDGSNRGSVEREAQYTALDDRDARSGATQWADALDASNNVNNAEQNNQNRNSQRRASSDMISPSRQPFRKRGRQSDWQERGRDDSYNSNASKRRRSDYDIDYDGRDQGGQGQWHGGNSNNLRDFGRDRDRDRYRDTRSDDEDRGRLTSGDERRRPNRYFDNRNL